MVFDYLQCACLYVRVVQVPVDVFDDSDVTARPVDNAPEIVFDVAVRPVGIAPEIDSGAAVHPVDISPEIDSDVAVSVGVKTGGSQVGGPDLCVLG